MKKFQRLPTNDSKNINASNKIKYSFSMNYIHLPSFCRYYIIVVVVVIIMSKIMKRVLKWKNLIKFDK